MSVVERLPPAAQKLQPLQKWYMPFPENWVQLAFDREWRMKRLKDLSFNQGTRYFTFWAFAGLLCFMFLLLLISGFTEQKEDVRSRLTMLILFVNMLVIFGIQCVNFLKIEFERLLLQIIDRLETRVLNHE
jgi:hypothetical protein